MFLKSLISKIVSYWKLISAVIGIAGVLIVGKAKYDSWIIAKAEKNITEIEDKKSDSTFKETVYQFIDVQSKYNKIQDSTQRDNSAKLNIVLSTQKNLKDYMIEKAATKQDLLDVVKVFEIEKKNEELEIH